MCPSRSSHTAGLNITLTERHNITPLADRQGAVACVLSLLRGLPLLVYKEEIKETCGQELFWQVCLYALFSDLNNVRADHLPTSHSQTAVISAQLPSAAECLRKQKELLYARVGKDSVLQGNMTRFCIGDYCSL